MALVRVQLLTRVPTVHTMSHCSSSQRWTQHTTIVSGGGCGIGSGSGSTTSKNTDGSVWNTGSVVCFSSTNHPTSTGSTHTTAEPLKTIGPGSHCAEMEIKKSRFLAFVKHVDSWDDAKQYIEWTKTEHPKARHWCHGYCGGSNPVNERSSDDGEPTGTAGVPILNAIRGQALSDTICVVVRYFGGIKLGAGGLIRAYGAAARLVLNDAPIEILIPKSTLRVTVPTEYIGTIYEITNMIDGSASDEVYGADGTFSLSITCDAALVDRLRNSLNNATKGNVILPCSNQSERM